MTKVLRILLIVSYLATYIWALYSLATWGTELIIVYAFFLFIPLIPYLVPFLGILMLVNNKKAVVAGYLASLTMLIYLNNAWHAYPITLYMGGEMTKGQYQLLLLSLISYILLSTLYFIIKMRRLTHNINSSSQKIIHTKGEHP